MKKCKTMTGSSIRNANKKIPEEGILGYLDYRNPVLWFSKEELKLMFPPKPLDLDVVS